jgi:hypothetical protein
VLILSGAMVQISMLPPNGTSGTSLSPSLADLLDAHPGALHHASLLQHLPFEG